MIYHADSDFAIKCGGPQTVSNQIVYENDSEILGPATYYVTSSNKWAVSNVGLFSSNNNVSYTSDAGIFQTTRVSAGSLRYYGLGLQNGNYIVNLLFAEIQIENGRTWRSLGRRVFDIIIQGDRVERDFDIRREAGDRSYTPVQRNYTVQVTENYLEIHLFWAGKGTCCIPFQGTYGPSISALSVTPLFRPRQSNSTTNASQIAKTPNIDVIVGIVVPVGVITLLSLGLCWFIRRRKRLRESEDELLGIDVKPYTFSYAELKSATRDFDPLNKLGEGGFGSVYKGLGRKWQAGDGVLEQVAGRGGVTHMSTGVAGTIGYVAPEYAMRGHLTEKVDVFAFGVVALEIVSGRSNCDPTLRREETYLLGLAWHLYENDQDEELVDKSLKEVNKQEVKRLIAIALLCTQTSAMQRPTMSSVLAMLLGDVEVAIIPSKPTYLVEWPVDGLIKVLNWLWFRPKKLEKWFRQQGLSGTSYQFLFGDMKHYSSTRARALEHPMNGFSNDFLPRVEPLRHQLVNKFGKDYFLWFGPTPIITITKPELIREAFMKKDVFRKVKVNPTFDKLFPGLASYEGEEWAKHRKLINPAFHIEKLKLMLPAFRDSCAEIINKWELNIGDMGSIELDVWPDLKNLTADVIARAAFSSNYEEGQRLFKLLEEQTALTILMLQSVYIPGLRYIPTPRNRKFNELETRILTSLRAIISKRKEEIEAGEEVKADLLGLLLDSKLKEIQQTVGDNKNDHVEMSLEEVIEECKAFYLAGQETTSVLLVWTLILLSKHQDWQARAREEVFQTFGNNVPDFEGLNQLKTVTMILYEVLRLYPPAIQLMRSIHKDTNLGTLSLPSGSLISISLLSVHRDQEFWGVDAEEFKPDRFSEGISKATKGNNSFLPFGWGPRVCIGERFAMTEAKMALAMILRCFSFELSPSYLHAPMTVILLQPQHGAQIVLHKL
ncbi:hypothetical protein BVRB_5g116620 [Beta vulgaris subsp. vulgaris]|nr:hypothetical protein BVRB_5g116620 [Beta vulgaris subsp. vulgaris]